MLLSNMLGTSFISRSVNANNDVFACPVRNYIESFLNELERKKNVFKIRANFEKEQNKKIRKNVTDIDEFHPIRLDRL